MKLKFAFVVIWLAFDLDGKIFFNYNFFTILYNIPICNTKKSGISGDNTLSYHATAEEWYNTFAHLIGLGGSYGDEF